MKRITILIIIIAVFFNFSCTDNNNLTGNVSNSDLMKPYEEEDFTSTKPNPFEMYASMNSFWNAMVRIAGLLTPEQLDMCAWFASGLIPQPSANIISQSVEINKSYDFRDDFLLKTEKGTAYVACYYLLSQHGIQNQLISKYSNKHIDFLLKTNELAYQLHHNKDNTNVIINKSTYEDCKEMVEIYRNSENHEEIDIILDYLEIDLEKYYNKPKAEIAVDFQ